MNFAYEASMSIVSDLTALFENLQKCADEYSTAPRAFIKRFPLIPPAINLGDGRSAFIDQEGIGALHRVATCIRQNSADYAGAMSVSEMINFVSRTIGELIRKENGTEYDIPTDANVFKGELNKRLEEIFKKQQTTNTHLFGVWLFRGASVAPLTLGPVRFLLREEWLLEVAESGLLTSEHVDRIGAYWRGEVKEYAKFDNLQVLDELANSVVMSVGDCRWVCTVKVKGHSDSRSEEKALFAARMGVMAIASIFQVPPGRNRKLALSYDFDNFRRHNSSAVKNVVFTPDRGEWA